MIKYKIVKLININISKKKQINKNKNKNRYVTISRSTIYPKWYYITTSYNNNKLSYTSLTL